MEIVSTEDYYHLDSIWEPIMDQIKQLKQWQQQHQQEVTQRQIQSLDRLNRQNDKLNALVEHIGDHSDEESMEQIRAEDKETSVGDDEQSCADYSSMSYLESSPVVPGIDGKKIKTFDELVDIRLNDMKNDHQINDSKFKTKKPFLRKGEGIKRFEPKSSQNDDKSKTGSKRVCFKDNEKICQTITRRDLNPKFSAKEYVSRKKLIKTEEISEKPKKFIRKVIPLTTKLDKSPKIPIQISRDTPTLIKGLPETDSDFFEYLLKMYDNISIDENEDIDDLRQLLNKIEAKKAVIQRQSSGSDRLFDNKFNDDFYYDNRNNDLTKKKVRWSLETQTSDESDEEVSDLIRPKAGAYSSKLRLQIDELEERLSLLKETKTNKINEKSLNKTEDICEPISSELSKLRQQIEKLNKRIVNIESKSYDLLSDCRQRSHRNNNLKCFVNKNVKTKPKTTVSSNISVNENQNNKTIEFPNGDKMTVSKDNTIFYIFANGTTQTTYPEGLRITNFPNGQTEKIHKNGVKHITYANGLQRIINPDTSEEVLMTDGTVWRIHSDGSEVLEFANGDREIRTAKYKRREYQNGNIKTLYSDGTEETRYVSGRLRIKDKSGNLMVDSMVRHLDQH